MNTFYISNCQIENCITFLFRFVINVPGEDGEDNYVQAVKVEKCLRPGESCNVGNSGYETTVCRLVLVLDKFKVRALLKILFQTKIYLQKAIGFWSGWISIN